MCVCVGVCVCQRDMVEDVGRFDSVGGGREGGGRISCCLICTVHVYRYMYIHICTCTGACITVHAEVTCCEWVKHIYQLKCSRYACLSCTYMYMYM